MLRPGQGPQLWSPVSCVCRRQALKLPDSFPVSPELRGENGCRGWLGRGPGERHRDPDFAPHPNPQKDSAKDPGISGEAPRSAVEPELRPEGRSSLRLGVRTGLGTQSRGALCLGTSHLFAHHPPHYRLCSSEPLLLPRPLQKVLLQRSVLRGVEQRVCQVSKDPLVPPHASWMAAH